MSRPYYYGFDRADDFLLEVAAHVREIPELGLHVARGIEKFVEDLGAAEAVHALEIRDLSRQLEDGS